MDEDTIVAISTPPGRGAMGIIRLSGPQATAVADALFRGRGRPSEFPSHTVHFGRLVDGEEVVDEVLLTVFRAPHSYTGEDVVEISCHGSPVVLRRVLYLAVRQGARLAEPGEFTKRAFLNGKMDLAQAEAVMDVVCAQTELSARAAMSQLEGHLSRRVEELRQQLIDFLAHLEAALDFTDEDIEIISPTEQRQRAEALLGELRRLAASAEKGKVLREGVTTVIAGRPNVGKSSLMNLLLREDRVIVTPVPGTTRDVVEDLVNIRGLPLRLLDTAGLRPTEDLVEREGVSRTQTWLERADLVLLVLDRSEPLQAEDRLALTAVAGRPTVVVLNKSDLPPRLETQEVARRLPQAPQVLLSALTGAGLSELEAAIERLVWEGGVEPGDVLVTNVRHQRALEEAAEYMERVLETLAVGYSEELVAVDLRGALRCVGEIVGETLTEDIIHRIFSTFCIGK
ncbi:MAG TPA: tRNA uridine-5-carboxymethylaminomethyl(34) synthesis GTPase MnmE [Armatimonadetes bacterium]|nr:tRNA uridine-5-carboxymethylaminomethyl(34) synthesis GTPase MnmE [Armatimonadota bacterium]